MKGAVKCSCCGGSPIYVDWEIVPGCIQWAVSCERRCFITQFFYKQARARKQWNNEDVQKALAAKGKWERRFYK